MLDPDLYPHIFDIIIESTPREGLLKLRAACHGLRAIADRILFRHVVIDLVPSPGILEVVDPLGNRLPVVPHLLQPSSCAHKIGQAAAILSEAEMIDVNARYDLNFDYWAGWRAKVAQTPILCALGRAHPEGLPWTIRLLVSYRHTTTISIPETCKDAPQDSPKLPPNDMITFLTSLAANCGYPQPSKIFDGKDLVAGSQKLESPVVFWSSPATTPSTVSPTTPPTAVRRRCVLRVGFHPSGDAYAYIPASFYIDWPWSSVGTDYVIHFVKLHWSSPLSSPHALSQGVLGGYLDYFPGTSYTLVGAEQLPCHPFGEQWKLGVAKDVSVMYLTQQEYRAKVGEERFAVETAPPLTRAGLSSKAVAR
jgi:hypothetical protein